MIYVSTRCKVETLVYLRYFANEGGDEGLNIRKTNEKGLKTLSFNDKDKIKGKMNSTKFDFLV